MQARLERRVGVEARGRRMREECTVRRARREYTVHIDSELERREQKEEKSNNDDCES